MKSPARQTSTLSMRLVGHQSQHATVLSLGEGLGVVGVSRRFLSSKKRSSSPRLCEGAYHRSHHALNDNALVAQQVEAIETIATIIPPHSRWRSFLEKMQPSKWNKNKSPEKTPRGALKKPTACLLRRLFCIQDPQLQRPQRPSLEVRVTLVTQEFVEVRGRRNAQYEE